MIARGECDRRELDLSDKGTEMNKYTTFLALAAIGCVVFDFVQAKEPRKSEIVKFESVQQDKDYRVSLLGVTKGIAFLDSEELVADGGRAHGKNVVPWMRVTTVIEKLTNKNEPLGFKAETGDGSELVGKVKIETNGRSTDSRSSAAAEMDFDFPLLLAATFPTGMPRDSSPTNSNVHLFTLSGKFQKTDTVTLRFSFGDPENRRELVFKNVPMP